MIIKMSNQRVFRFSFSRIQRVVSFPDIQIRTDRTKRKTVTTITTTEKDVPVWDTFCTVEQLPAKDSAQTTASIIGVGIAKQDPRDVYRKWIGMRNSLKAAIERSGFSIKAERKKIWDKFISIYGNRYR